MLNFKYSDIKINGVTMKIIKSFQILSEDHAIEFFSPNNYDLIKIHKILKTKLNFSGFHDTFKSIKQIGKGNFASVIFHFN